MRDKTGKTVRIPKNFEDPAKLQGSEGERIKLFRQVRDEMRNYFRGFAGIKKCYPYVKFMRRALASSFLSLLLLTTLMWGGCISCEEYFMWAGAKSCYAHDGHCKKNTPTQQSAGRECKQIAFDHQKSVDVHIDLAVAVNAFSLPLRTIEPFALWHDANPMGPSPPDLQALHSTFLI